MEVWKDIPGYEGLYQASSEGRIKSLERVSTTHARFKARTLKERIMKGRFSKVAGYKVCLWKDGVMSEYLVARLVASTFCGEPKEGATVNHKDGNRLNNKVGNLEWLSLGDNIRYGFEHGQYTSQKPITLFGEDGKWHHFRSISECSRFLGKSNGYITQNIEKQRLLKDKRGKVYQYS